MNLQRNLEEYIYLHVSCIHLFLGYDWWVSKGDCPQSRKAWGADLGPLHESGCSHPWVVLYRQTQLPLEDWLFLGQTGQPGCKERSHLIYKLSSTLNCIQHQNEVLNPSSKVFSRKFPQLTKTKSRLTQDCPLLVISEIKISEKILNSQIIFFSLSEAYPVLISGTYTRFFSKKDHLQVYSFK